MRRHHSPPTAWLFTDERLGPDLLGIVRRLPRGSGVILRHHELAPTQRRAQLRRLRRLAITKGLTVLDEQEVRIARVHSPRELRQALARKPQILFLSPLFATRSHPDWQPLGRMRAAALVRLAGRPVLALGGMNGRRYRQVRTLGFSGWGGIDAWVP